MKEVPFRRQLTLFVEGGGENIESIRSKYNPIQYGLIAAHVTLCREDEISDLDDIIDRISALNWVKPLEITFDQVDRIDAGKGVIMPASKENSQFEELRTQILGNGVVPNAQAHITLMHPRNSSCSDEVFETINSYQLPTKLSFSKVSLIEQRNGGKWELLNNWKFAKS